jgi:hypothetical protein
VALLVLMTRMAAPRCFIVAQTQRAATLRRRGGARSARQQGVWGTSCIVPYFLY